MNNPLMFHKKVNFLRPASLITVGIILCPAILVGFLGCSQAKPRPDSNLVTGGATAPQPEVPMDFNQPWEQAPGKSATTTGDSPRFQKSFQAESPMDELLNKKPITLKEITPAPAQSTSDKNSPTEIVASEKKASETSNEKKFRIQLLSVADMETAQEKKREYSYLIGASVDIVFDAPFYKLRFGRFSNKRQGEDKLLDLMDVGLSGFVIQD